MTVLFALFALGVCAVAFVQKWGVPPDDDDDLES